MTNIAIAGSVSVDITVRNPPANWCGEDGIDGYTPELISKLQLPIDVGLGGNGAAPAYVIGKLGGSVFLSAPVGTDMSGQLTRRWLDDAGVRLLGEPTASTMSAVTAVDDQGKRLGCLQYVGPPVDWLAATQCDDAAWLLIGTHTKATQEDYDNILLALTAARGHGTRTALDSGLSWLRTLQPAAMHALWRQCDLVIGTGDELAAWSATTDPEAIARCVLEHGPRNVIVKLGAEGAAWQGVGEPFGHQAAHRPGSADVTVGAGDGFNGGALAALARGDALGTAVDAGQEVAGAIVQSGRGILGWQ
ncbi:MAG: carbohydrate kinase family protein [Lentisphaeria bacterium]|jgi:sugar/nucleoside kinase (ribokinase family)|nr:carbohydrate kinase family protein [Lentisphaeria bacterium]MDP7741251.1 carbohydrate kinase family protein [Lentisphaeria bacterium]